MVLVSKWQQLPTNTLSGYFAFEKRLYNVTEHRASLNDDTEINMVADSFWSRYVCGVGGLVFDGVFSLIKIHSLLLNIPGVEL